MDLILDPILGLDLDLILDPILSDLQIHWALATGPSLLTVDRGAKCRLRILESKKSSIIVMDGTSLTLEPIELQKTTTTQNDRNYLRISNFYSKIVFALHGQSAAQGHIVLGPGLLF